MQTSPVPSRRSTLRVLFITDINSQGIKFIEMLQAIMAALDRLDNLVPLLWPTGQRHGGYGVQSGHYTTVRSALIWAMEQRLGTFPPQTLAAWGILYDLIAAAMQQAANERVISRNA